MGQKNRLVIVIVLVALIVGAMFTSFGRGLFALNTPEVVLPGAGGSGSLPDPGGDPLFQQVEVTTQTVTGVVATLARPSSYYRELTVETFWEGGGSSSQVQVWVDGGFSHIRQTTPSGVLRHDLVGEGTLYYWYEGDTHYQAAPADGLSSDLAQHIPTYETVLELDPSHIISAGYERKGDLPCVYVEVRPQGGHTLERYWVSVDNGLLVAAELEEDGQVVYQMSAWTPVQSPCPAGAQFTLPGGEVLYQAQE